MTQNLNHRHSRPPGELTNGCNYSLSRHNKKHVAMSLGVGIIMLLVAVTLLVIEDSEML